MHVASVPAAGGGIVMVSSPKGGCGATVVAVGLALALHQAGEPAVLVDLNLTHGGADALLGLQPARTVLDLAALGRDLGEEHLELAAVRHPGTGLPVIGAPADLGPHDRVQPAEARIILHMCRRRWRWVIVDAPGSYPELLRTLAGDARQLLLVTHPSPPAVRPVFRMLQVLDGAPAALVVNCCTPDSPFSGQEVAARLGVPLAAAIPLDRHLAGRVFLGDPGQPPVRPGVRRPSPAEAALLAMARRLSGTGTPDRRNERGWNHARR